MQILIHKRSTLYKCWLSYSKYFTKSTWKRFTADFFHKYTDFFAESFAFTCRVSNTSKKEYNTMGVPQWFNYNGLWKIYALATSTRHIGVQYSRDVFNYDKWIPNIVHFFMRESLTFHLTFIYFFVRAYSENAFFHFIKRISKQTRRLFCLFTLNLLH